MNGKGDRQRPVDRSKFESNYDSIRWSQDETEEVLYNRPCYVCMKELADDWPYLCCPTCGQHCDLDFDTDERTYQEWRERHGN